MKKQLIICFILLSLLILTTNSVLATQYNYSTIDYPNAYSTQIAGINNYGQFVGWYLNSDGGDAHGFIFDGSGFNAIDVPSATQTYAYGINDSGLISGTYNIDSAWHGFLYNGSGYITIDFPGSSKTQVRGINNSGHVVGEYSDASGIHGFLRDEVGIYSTVDFPGASWTNLEGINDNGKIVGYYNSGSGDTAFQYDYNVDNYVTINNLTIANGINDSGIIVGDSGGSSYVINGDEYSLITYPGASLTDVVGINDSGNIVGWYNDDSGTHGFTATIVPEPISSILFVTGGAVLAGRRYLKRKRGDA